MFGICENRTPPRWKNDAQPSLPRKPGRIWAVEHSLWSTARHSLASGRDWGDPPARTGSSPNKNMSKTWQLTCANYYKVDTMVHEGARTMQSSTEHGLATQYASTDIIKVPAKIWNETARITMMSQNFLFEKLRIRIQLGEIYRIWSESGTNFTCLTSV